MHENLRAAAIAPPRGCGDLPDVGGVMRARLEDFVVEELPAYESDGRPGHLLLSLTKRGLTSEDALRELARQLQVPRAEIGLAGLKDFEAVTTQRVSVPDRAATALARFAHPKIELGDPQPHSHKLRRGHLRGNRFTITLRRLPVAVDEAQRRASAKLERIAAEGLRNYYGAQRFGLDGRNVEPGLAALAGKGPRRGKADLVVSAGQSALFNLYLAVRAERDCLHARGTGLNVLGRALLGDILQKRDTGGMFECSDVTEDQRRLDAGELLITGPMFGSKLRGPSAGTPSEALELEILTLARLTRAKLDKLGRKVPGARRPLLIWPEQVAVRPAPDVDALGPGLELHFVLPPGSYATTLVRELCG